MDTEMDIARDKAIDEHLEDLYKLGVDPLSLLSWYKTLIEDKKRSHSLKMARESDPDKRFKMLNELKWLNEIL